MQCCDTHRDHKLRRDPCSIKTVLELVKKYEETRYTSDKLRLERPSVPDDIVAEMINRITADPSHTARSVKPIWIY